LRNDAVEKPRQITAVWRKSGTVLRLENLFRFERWFCGRRFSRESPFIPPSRQTLAVMPYQLKRTMKFLKFFTKYFTLIFLFGVLIYLTKYYGNYCLDIFSQFFLLPLLSIIILVNIAILYLIDSKKSKYKTTNYTLIFCFTALTINLLIGFSPNYKTQKFKIKLQSDYERPELILYLNNTYQLKTGYPHGQCYKLGKYKLINDTLLLDHEIENKSQNLITRKYLLKNDTLKSLNNEFKDLVITQ